ncbi:MAG: hypothetical protein NUW01_04720 [Gemmatimonadaceae bacterium]|nr:hypothetical protein [Gemmatimonadaceae bacterium]
MTATEDIQRRVEAARLEEIRARGARLFMAASHSGLVEAYVAGFTDAESESQAEVERLREALGAVLVHDTDDAPADICVVDILNIVERALNPVPESEGVKP